MRLPGLLCKTVSLSPLQTSCLCYHTEHKEKNLLILRNGTASVPFGAPGRWRDVFKLCTVDVKLAKQPHIPGCCSGREAPPSTRLKSGSTHCWLHWTNTSLRQFIPKLTVAGFFGQRKNATLMDGNNWKDNTQAKVCRIIIMEETAHVKTWHGNLIQDQ